MTRIGYIRLHRKVEFCAAIGTDWFLAGAWSAVLLKACYSASTYRGQPVERGEFGYTYRELASQWEKSHNTIRKVFDHFEEHGMIRRIEKGGVSFVVVPNYSSYQSDSVSRGDTERDTQSDTQRDSVSRGDTERDTQSDTQRDTLNKKDKNTRKRESARAFTPPSIGEVTNYCNERKNNVDPLTWYDHYKSNGWRVGKNPMRDWQAAVRTWEKREREFIRGNRKPAHQIGPGQVFQPSSGETVARDEWGRDLTKKAVT